MDATTRYRLATGRMAELQAEAMANRLAAEVARAQQQPLRDGPLTSLARVLRLPSVRFGRAGLFARRSGSADCS